MPVYRYYTKSGYKYYVKSSFRKTQIIKRGFSSKAEAIAYDNNLKNADSETLKNINKTVREYVPLFFQDIDSKVKITTATFKKTIFKNHILPYFNDIKLKDINDRVLKVYATYVNNNSRFKQKERVFTYLKELLTFLKDFGLSQNLSFRLLHSNYDSFNFQLVEYDYYTREEFEQFIEVVDDPRFKLFFLMLFNYGLRISEALGLRHVDINLNLDKIFINGAITVKTNKKGQIRITPKTKSSYREYPLINSIKECYLFLIKDKRIKNDDYVFKSLAPGSLVIGEQTIRRYQRKYEKLAGLRHIKLHEFRHSCATELINNGFLPEQVASWLGHSSSLTTLKVYFHLFPSRKNAIANYYNSKEKKEE